MSDVSESAQSEREQQALAFATGQAAFERGLYRAAVDALVQAVALGDRNSRLGGDIQMWLVTAYAAADQRDEALTLCRQLTLHPYGEIRKQSKRLLYILEAPKLESRPEWLTQIPDLNQVSDPDRISRIAASNVAPEPQRFMPSEPIDLSEVETEDNGFAWIALVAIALLSLGLIWLA